VVIYPSRIVVAGDGTLLVADDDLTDASPVASVLSANDPLREAAEALLAGGTTDAALTVRLLPATRHQIAALEISTPDAAVAPLLMGGWLWPEHRGHLDWSPELAAIYGYSTEGATRGVTEYAASLLLPAVPEFLSGVKDLFATGRALRDVRVVRRDTDEIRNVRLYGWVPSGEPGTRPVGITIDVTDLSDAPDPSTRFFEAVISVVPDTVMVVDVESGEMLWANSRLAERLGFPLSRVRTFDNFRNALHWSDREIIDAIMQRLRGQYDVAAHDVRFRIKDGSGRWRWMHIWVAPWMSGLDGRVEQIVCTIRDVDEAVRAEKRLLWEAGHDPLTGLANRRVITETLQKAADDPNHARRYVYFVDLDDFKKVNDALGHTAGDELLRTLAARISVLVSASDVVGRFGGDELIIVSSMAPEDLGDRLLAAIRRPVIFGTAEVSVSGSVGIALIEVDEHPGDVVQRSNEAMYAAKRGGRDRWEAAGPLNTGPAQERVELEAGLRRAVREFPDELQVVFQPIVEHDRRPVAAEALLRWRHPTRGSLPPSQFLNIAEDANLMAELGELIIRKSLSAAGDWTVLGEPLLVTVNVGGRQLGTGGLEQLIIRLLDETGTKPDQLCLEVTESVLVDADSPELAELFRLRELGVEIALDDFGTGYAPLTYLKRLPATIVKLDKSFVAGVGCEVPDPIDVAVARAVVQLADEVGLRVIAEGVESQRQADVLAEMGYRLFQGFWAHTPMPSAELRTLLARR
jgi:diguanylate cyclase (GGDEF)-like protein/PAS domain S-box-containing protein